MVGLQNGLRHYLSSEIHDSNESAGRQIRAVERKTVGAVKIKSRDFVSFCTSSWTVDLGHAQRSLGSVLSRRSDTPIPSCGAARPLLFAFLSLHWGDFCCNSRDAWEIVGTGESRLEGCGSSRGECFR